MSNPAIGFLPYGMALGSELGQVPLQDIRWPLGCPERLRGGQIGDLSSTDHLIIYPKTSTHFTLRRGTRARISLLLGEPSVIHAKHIRLLHLTHRRFHRILTFNQSLLDRLPNAILFPLGGTWVPEWRELEIEKTRDCSLIASAKRDTEGHKLRHAVADWCRLTGLDVDVLGGGYAPFERKSEGLAPYRYSVVIENMPERNYFSEKLVDAVLCETIPIYWGCPNLRDFFDPEGVIECRTEAEIRAAIQSMSHGDYAARLPALRRTKVAIEAFADVETRAAQAVLDSLG